MHLLLLVHVFFERLKVDLGIYQIYLHVAHIFFYHNQQLCLEYDLRVLYYCNRWSKSAGRAGAPYMAMPCCGSAHANPPPRLSASPVAAPVSQPRRHLKKSRLICVIIPACPCLSGLDRSDGFKEFQTFSFETSGGLRITRALLDRFLACMKPASIT